jgi:hypothetical protein
MTARGKWTMNGRVFRHVTPAILLAMASFANACASEDAPPAPEAIQVRSSENTLGCKSQSASKDNCV